MATRSIPVQTKHGTQVKQRRAGGSKVRTGCITCKIRRVKCDETKPACLRCIKFGTKCDGYAVKKSAKGFGASKKPLQSIAPKIVFPRDIPHTPQRKPFANDQEYRYFRLFCERTATALAGYFKGSLWNRIVLQACEDMPPIRHAIIALGALDKTLDITLCKNGLRDPRLPVTASESAAHHRFALQQYNQALTQMRNNMSAQKRDYRNASILCLLTICFEALNGDMQSALGQIRNGLKLIKEWKLSMMTSTPALGFTSTMDNFGNEELVRAFSFLDNNSIMIMNAVPVIGADDEHAIENIPESFASLEDARAHFELLTNRMLHWTASAYAWGAQEKDEAARRAQPSAAAHGEIRKPRDYQQVIEEKRQEFIERFREWHSTFQPLWLDSQSMKSNKNFPTALVLEMRFKVLYICTLANHFKGDIVFDAFTAQFREVVALAKIFVEHEKLQSDSQRASFTFNDPFISSVYIVALKCRDPTLRREAIALLESHPRRDGVMDSALMARIATLQMNIEEAESQGNYIPEHARIRGIKTTTDMAKRAGQMKYLKMASSSNRQFVVHHVDFTW